MTGGKIGDAPPEDYFLIRAARYLRVAPWELVDRPPIWQDLALATERAEIAAAGWSGPDAGADE